VIYVPNEHLGERSGFSQVRTEDLLDSKQSGDERARVVRTGRGM
jgi:hypothetical protein